jgi:hypothetical protein
MNLERACASCYQTSVSETLQKIIEELKTLSEEERRQLVRLLHGLNGSGSAPSSKREFEERLAAEGLVSLPTPPSGDSPVSLGPPLTVHGRPLSEILLEERR